MADSLAVSLISSNKHRNFATPTDTVRFQLEQPPASATNVVISVLESIRFLDPRTPNIVDRVIGTFSGRITSQQFLVDQISTPPLPMDPDPVKIAIEATPNPKVPRVFARVAEPERLESHTLRLTVQGTVNGVQIQHNGGSLVQIEYPLAMIVPAVVATPQDRTLNVVHRWAEQWRLFKPDFRHVETLPAVRVFREAQPHDYDKLIAAAHNAAQKATAGVVALAVGHGDSGNDHGNIPWCNLTPEDFPAPTDGRPFLYQLYIDDAVLNDGLTSGSVQIFPTGSHQVKLDALDRLADTLKGTPIRRLLLHTCTAGANLPFIQKIADRVQVPIVAHTKHIAYEDAPIGQMGCNYDDEAPVRPRDLHHWLVANMTAPVRPGKPPRRFGPPPK